MKKKLLISLLALSMSLSLVACGNKDKEKEAAPDAVTAEIIPIDESDNKPTEEVAYRTSDRCIYRQPEAHRCHG